MKTISIIDCTVCRNAGCWCGSQHRECAACHTKLEACRDCAAWRIRRSK